MTALFERHRPTSLDAVVGQSAAVAQVRAVLALGWGGRAWWITGASGCGKTTLARIIAADGCDELGVEEIDAQTLTPAKLREIEGEMRFRMLGVKPGRAYIVNEAHGLRKDTIRQLLVVLERLPDYCVWVFTTTKAGEVKLFDDDVAGDAAPLLSRCIEIVLENGTETQRAFAERAREIGAAEGLGELPLSVYSNAVSASAGNMRRVLQRLESGSFRADALAELEREWSMVKAIKGTHGDERRAVVQAALDAVKGKAA